ncbi:hypothetical protein Syun_017092 [Stephania yunnanensis]|uniref:Uncharacterized protein n=1 Tax=Stephania yunnanensis TaxID=152371 RepID=A0AAP0J7V9_9MAGN
MFLLILSKFQVKKATVIYSSTTKGMNKVSGDSKINKNILNIYMKVYQFLMK